MSYLMFGSKMQKLLRIIPRRLRLQLKGLLSSIAYSNLSFQLNLPKVANKKHFHFANIVGSHRVSNLIEPSLAKFLILRGHTVSVAICDGALPACLACSIWLQPNNKQNDEDFITPSKLGICPGCYKPSIKTWSSTGARVFKVSDYPQDGKKNIIENNYAKKIFKVNNIDFSEDVIAGCLRFLCKGDEDTISLDLWKHYANAVIKIYNFYDALLTKEKFDLIFSVHGIYIPHGITNKIFQTKKINFYNYNSSYRQQRFYFTKNETYHRAFPTQTHTDLKLKDVTDNEINEIKKYLESREYGSEDWQQFNNEPDDDIGKYLAIRNFNFDNETAVLFSNVVWDARLHFSENTYPDMLEWIYDTVQLFKEMPNRNLIIRTHPGEILSHSKSRERLRDMSLLKTLPKNIYFIDANEKISSYGLARISSLNLIYASKIGMELSRMDAPIITCGDAWVKNKNATISPRSKNEYKDLLKGEWKKLNSKYQKRNGLAYAHYIFQKKPLQFEFLQLSSDRKSFKINKTALKQNIKNFLKNDLHKIELADKNEI